MQQCSRYIITLAAIVVLLATSAQAEPFTVFTNNVPPIKYVEDNKLKGVAGEILDALMHRTNQRIKQVVALPLEDVYQQLHSTNHSICPALGRTPQREKLFKWVGPVYSTRFGMIVKKSRLSELKKANRADLVIGSVNKSVPEEVYRSKFPSRNVLPLATTSEAIHSLADDTIDILVFAVTPAFHLIAHEGFDPNNFYVFKEIDNVDLYIAFDPNTSDRTIKLFQNALDDMKRQDTEDNEYNRIVSRYFVPPL